MQQHFQQVANGQWPLANALQVAFRRTDYSAAAVGSIGAAKMGQLIGVWPDLAELAAIRCKICNGYGHSLRLCPTAKRLRAAWRSNLEPRNRLASVINDMTVRDAQHVAVAGQYPRMSSAPVLLAGSKRPRHAAAGGAAGGL